MEKKEIIDFFDRCAPWWDADMVRDEQIIHTILTLGGIREGIDVLDVACGTGVLFGDYLQRGVRSVTAIDISPEMAKIAASKYAQIRVICGDVETEPLDQHFDAVMVYNAFPHFPKPRKLIERLAGLTRPGGRLTVAHGMSRAALTAHHGGRASSVSVELLPEQELAALFSPYFDVDVTVSTDRMYQVSGVRKAQQAPSEDKGAQDPGAAMEELLALMGFMVRHNDAHAQELAQLAGQLRAAGYGRACGKLMDTVSDFDMVNARLEAVRAELAADVL